MIRLLIIFSCFLFICSCASNSTKDEFYVSEAGSYSTTETATIEKVVRIEANGYTNLSYQITWEGQTVLINDPILHTNYEVGDTVKILVFYQHLEFPNSTIKSLSFAVLKL